jgi:SAM-dependent methyltransferase
VAFVEQPQVWKLRDEARILDLGCGRSKLPGAVGIDRLVNTDADVCHDLDEFPYPFDVNSFDAVVARHVLEHLADPLSVLAELHRITKPGGTVFVVTPHFSSPTSWTDPTHRHHLAAHSFDYLIEGTPWNFYSGARYKIVSRRITLGMMRGPAGRVFPLFRLMGVEALVNRYLDVFERWWAFTLPLGNRDLVLELQVVK